MLEGGGGGGGRVGGKAKVMSPFMCVHIYV